MRAGTLHSRIKLLKPVTVASDSGPQQSYQHVDLEWASINIKAGNEKVSDQSVRSSLTYDILIRHRDDIKSDWQIKYQDQLLDIVSVFDPDQRRRELIIQAVAHGR